MSTKRAKQETSKAEVKETEVKTSEALVGFDEYIAKAKVNPLLVASFKYEAEQTEKGLQDRSEEQWKADFEAQSNRVYE